MITKREAISSLRDKLRERNADNNYSNHFLYNSLLEQAKWLIKRELTLGKIYRNTSLFQTYKCTSVVKASLVEKCCPIKTGCTIYRSKHMIPETWVDNNGPVIKAITSVDNNTKFTIIDPLTWQAKRNDPYRSMMKTYYVFYSGGYLWFPEVNPHKVNIHAYFTDVIQELECEDCKEDNTNCIRFLDREFMIPDWILAELYAKTLELLLKTSKSIPEDLLINKNTALKN